MEHVIIVRIVGDLDREAALQLLRDVIVLDAANVDEVEISVED